MIRNSRRRVTTALATCAGLAGLLAGPSALLAHAPLMPDLVADPSDTALTSLERMQAGGSHHLLLRFPGYVHNAGPGRLEIFGSLPQGDWQSGQRRMTSVVQRLYDDIGELEGSLISGVVVPRTGIDAPEAHQHWHNMRVAAYALVDASSLTEVAQSAKEGFCVADTTRVEAAPSTPPRYDPDLCRGADAGGNTLNLGNSQDAVSVTMGLSPGFRDTYGAYMWTQWVDLTGTVSPGRYKIRTLVDPENVIFEEHEVNPPAYGPEIALRGWLPLPQTAAPGPAGATQAITLRATEVEGGGLLPDGDSLRGRPGPVQYALASAPAHGSVVITDGVASYTPDPSYSGPDSFGFTASEPGTRLAKPVATVALTVQPPPVAALTTTAGDVCAPPPAPRPTSGKGRLALTLAQLRINQRIGSAGLRRLEAVEAWLNAGIEARDICGGTIGPEKLAPGIIAIPQPASIAALQPPNPRPVTPRAATPKRNVTFTLSRAQLLINQRIYQALIRRAAALKSRLDGGLSGGDVSDGAIGQPQLHDRLAIAGTSSAPPAAPTTTEIATPGPRSPGAVTLSLNQLGINQRVAQGGVRRANALIDRLTPGLTGSDLRDGTIGSSDLAPGVAG